MNVLVAGYLSTSSLVNTYSTAVTRFSSSGPIEYLTADWSNSDTSAPYIINSLYVGSSGTYFYSCANKYGNPTTSSAYFTAFQINTSNNLVMSSVTRATPTAGIEGNWSPTCNAVYGNDGSQSS